MHNIYTFSACLTCSIISSEQFQDLFFLLEKMFLKLEKNFFDLAVVIGIILTLSSLDIKVLKSITPVHNQS